jgi:hypothetical protein
MTDTDATNDTNTGSDSEDWAQAMLGALAGEREDNEEDTTGVPDGVNDSSADDYDRPVCDATEPSGLHLWLSRRIGVGELDHMFKRRGELVRVIPGAIQPLDARRLRAEIDYTFRSIRHTDKGVRDTNFPLIAAENACGAVHRLPNARELAGITSIPLFRSDGDLIDREGYDDVTRMLYQPEDGLKINVPDEPSRQALFEAATLIKYPVAQFPFESDADKANWIGMAFTPLLRYLAPGPYKLGIIEAHQPGSGKGYLAGMLRKLHGGTLRGALPDKEAEMRKTITTALLGAEGIIVFDNVKGMISSPSLEALLTAETWSDRLLGGNTEATIANDRLWILTGNNASIGGDMARRVLKVRLDAGPSPENRTGFDIANPVKWMGDHRGEYLSALMTVIRSWLYAGAQMPPATGSDSYALWRQMLSGILSHAGLGEEFDAKAVRPAMSDEDDEWESFLHAVKEHFGNAAWNTKDLGNALNMSPTLEALMPGAMAQKWTGFSTTTFVTSLGRFLGHRERKWFGDISVVRSERKTRGVYMWNVKTLSQ